MVDQPLQPFSPPTLLTALLPKDISYGVIVEWALYIVFAFWALYTIIAVYHWLKYSHASLVAFPAIAVHFFISFSLIVFALTGTRIV